MTALKGDVLGRPLVPCELAVVRKVAEGKSNRQIAAECGITYASEKQYLHRAMCKLGFHNRTEIAVWLARALGC